MEKTNEGVPLDEEEVFSLGSIRARESFLRGGGWGSAAASSSSLGKHGRQFMSNQSNPSFVIFVVGNDDFSFISN